MSPHGAMSPRMAEASVQGRVGQSTEAQITCPSARNQPCLDKKR